MRRNRKQAVYCWSFLLLHLVADSDGWVTAPRVALSRRLPASLKALSEGNSHDQPRCERRNNNKRQTNQDNDAVSSWPFNRDSPHLSNKIPYVTMKITSRNRPQSALFATFKDDDPTTMMDRAGNATKVNSDDLVSLTEEFSQKDVIQDNEVSQSNMSSFHMPLDKYKDLIADANSSSSVDQKSIDKQPISSVARVFAGLFGDFNASQAISNDTNNSSNIPQTTKENYRSAKLETLSTHYNQQLNVSARIPGSHDAPIIATFNASLGVEYSPATYNFSSSANDTTSSLESKYSLVSYEALALQIDEEQSISRTCKDYDNRTAPEKSLPRTATIKENVSSVPTSGLDEMVSETPKRKKTKFKVTWLDDPVKSDKKNFVTARELSASNSTGKNLTAQTTTSDEASLDTIGASSLLDSNSTVDSKSHSQETSTDITNEALDIDQSLDSSTGDSVKSFSFGNITLSNEDNTTKQLTSELTSTRLSLDDGVYNSTGKKLTTDTIGASSLLDSNSTVDSKSHSQETSTDITNEALDIDQSLDSSTGDSVKSFSFGNITLSNEDNTTIQLTSELTSTRFLDDGVYNATFKSSSFCVSDTGSLPPTESIQILTQRDFDLATTFSSKSDTFESAPPPAPLLPDAVFASPNTNFEPGSPPAPLLPRDNVALVKPKFELGSPPAPLLPDDNIAPASPVYEPRSPPAPLLPNDNQAPGSSKFDPGSPPAPLLPKDTFSPASPYKADAPPDNLDFDPTKPPKNFGSFVQEIAKDMMPDFGGTSMKPVAEFGSFVKEVAKEGMPTNENASSDASQPSSNAETAAQARLQNDSEKSGISSNHNVIAESQSESSIAAEEWDPRKPPSNFGSFVSQVAKSRMSGSDEGFDFDTGELDRSQDDQKSEDTFSAEVRGIGTSDQANTADMDSSISQRATKSYDRAEIWDPWKFDVVSQTLGKSSNFPSSTIEDFSGSGLEISNKGQFASSTRGTQSSFERVDTWDPWKFDVMSQTLGKSTIFPSSQPADFPGEEETSFSFDANHRLDDPYFPRQNSHDSSFDRAKNWDPWKFDVMSQTLGKSTIFPSSSPEDFVNTGISSSSMSQGKTASSDSSTRSSFERAETWDPWKFDVLSQTLGKSTIFPSSAPQDFSTGDDQSGQPPSPQPGQRVISYEKTESWDPRTFNVLSQTLGKSTSFSVPDATSVATSTDSTGSWEKSPSNSFSRAVKWDPWAFDVLKQTLGKSTLFPSSSPQDFTGNGDSLGGDWGASSQESSQESRYTGPLGPSSSSYSPQGVFNRPKTVSGTFDPSSSLSGSNRHQSTDQGPSMSSWNSASSTISSGSNSDYTQPSGVYDPTSQSKVTSYLQDATRAHFGSSRSESEDSFSSQNSQYSSDLSGGRFKMLTGEAAPLQWDPVLETWVEQGTGKPVEATYKSDIAPPKKQERVSVAPFVVPPKYNETPSNQQAPSLLQNDEEQSSNNPSFGPKEIYSADRKKFFADLFENDPKSNNKINGAATVYGGDTSRATIFGEQLKQPSKGRSGNARSSTASSDSSRPSAGGDGDFLKARSSVDQVRWTNPNREVFFSDFLRNNYQPGSLRLDIPENIFTENRQETSSPDSRKSEYIDNTASRGFGPFQGGWGRPLIAEERPADNVFIDLPNEDEQQIQMSPFSDSYPEESQFGREGPFMDVYQERPQPGEDGPPLDISSERLDFEREESSKNMYNDIPVSNSKVPPVSSSSVESQSSYGQNEGSYLNSMRRPSDDEMQKNSGVFDWGSYVSEQRNKEEAFPAPTFSVEDPDGYYTANPTLYDSGADDYPPAISFAEASRPQMRSYLDSLYKSSQANGYRDSIPEEQSASYDHGETPSSPFDSFEQNASYDFGEMQSSAFESSGQGFYDYGEKQSLSADTSNNYEETQSSSFELSEQKESYNYGEPQSFSTNVAVGGESSTQPSPYFVNTEWNPKEGADPNQNPFARFVYTDSGSQTSGSSLNDSGFDSSSVNYNNDQYIEGNGEKEDSQPPRRGSQVYPEVKNSWFGGGSYLDSMSQRKWNEEQND